MFAFWEEQVSAIEANFSFPLLVHMFIAFLQLSQQSSIPQIWFLDYEPVL